jgi:hypothetical protein
VGLPLLLVPGWLAGTALQPLLAGLTLAGGGGWPAVVLELNLLGALLVTQVFMLALAETGRRGIALLVALALGLTNPLMTYSYLIFPAVPAALFVLYSFRRLNLGWSSNGLLRVFSVGLCLAYLPWLHFRLVPLSLGLLAYALRNWRHVAGTKSDLAKLSLLLLPLLLSALLLASYHQRLYGELLPNVSDHAEFMWPWRRGGWKPALLGALGLLLDQRWGLITHAPLLVLSLTGAVVMWREGGDVRRRSLWLGLIALPYYGLISSYGHWWGEWSPPGRYLVPLVPLAAVPLAHALLCLQRSLLFKSILALLLAASLLIMLAMWAGLGPRAVGQVSTFFDHPFHDGSLSTWLRLKVGCDPFAPLPYLVPWFLLGSGPIPWLELGLYVLALLLLAALAALPVQRNP